MKLICLCFFILFTTACSRTQVMFRFFDNLAASKADDYFDLNRDQKKELQKGLQQDLDRMRQDLFPEVAKSLREAAPLAEQNRISYEDLHARYEELQKHFKKATGFFVETSVNTTLSLSNDQFEHFKKEVQNDIEEDQDPEDVQDTIYKRYRRSLEFWVGGLTSHQKDLLKEFLKKEPYPAVLQNENKKYVMEKFLALRGNPEGLKKFVRDFFTDYESLRLPQFTQTLNKHKEAFQRFFAESFVPTLTPHQKKHLKENLLDRAQELEDLSHKGKGA